jgi:hypothetical protein
MNSLTVPAVVGAGLLSAPAFWGAFVDGTTVPQTALLPFTIAAVLAWAALNVLALVVGPAPGDTTTDPQRSDDPEAGAGPGTAFDQAAVQPVVEPVG